MSVDWGSSRQSWQKMVMDRACIKGDKRVSMRNRGTKLRRMPQNREVLFPPESPTPQTLAQETRQ
jgi:hypothetical protein